MGNILVTSYLIDINANGSVNYYKKLDKSATDFKIQPNGYYTYFDTRAEQYYMMNRRFEIVDSFYSRQFKTNNHELVVTEKGNYYLIADNTKRMDLTDIIPGGQEDAEVTANVIQGFDANKKLIFNWNGFDYYKLTDAAKDINLTAKVIDYIHTNSIEIDTDSNLIISSRNIDEITKIDRKTGKIFWRFGGKNNQFSFIDDPLNGFSHQHDVRRLKNGNILLFDNGNSHTPTVSRAVEYKLDEIKKEAKLVWEYRHSPEIFSAAMGSAQRMPNGNTLIGWGFNISFATNMYMVAATEVDSLGNVVFEMNLAALNYSYRVYHYDAKSASAGGGAVKTIAANESGSPEKINLTLYPNPFNPSTILKYNTPSSGPVTIKLYDALGREIKTLVDNSSEEGTHTLSVSGTELAGGIYFVRMQTKDAVKTVKAILLK